VRNCFHQFAYLEFQILIRHDQRFHGIERVTAACSNRLGGLPLPAGRRRPVDLARRFPA
jgi:hypothetical protein